MTDTIKISRELHQQGVQLLDNWDSGHPAYDLGKLGLEAVELVRALLAQPSEPQGGEEVGHVPDDAFYDEFAAWWESDGQYVRSGGGDYERSFAFEAWRYFMPKIAQHRRLMAEQLERERGVVEALRLARDYVYSELEERKAAMAGYPHKWATEQADLATIDEALAAWEKNHGK